MKIDLSGKKGGQQKNPDKPIDPITADIVNVKRIEDHFLYTRDGYIHCYIKVEPISIDLMSKNEQRRRAQELTAEISGGRYEFKLLIVQRPVDLSGLVIKYTTLLHESNNPTETLLLRDEINTMNRYILGGEIVEKQFYFMLWDHDGAENDLLKRARDFAERLDINRIKCKILADTEIVLLCNLINNPAYINLEDTDYFRTVPLLD